MNVGIVWGSASDIFWPLPISGLRSVLNPWLPSEWEPRWEFSWLRERGTRRDSLSNSFGLSECYGGWHWVGLIFSKGTITIDFRRGKHFLCVINRSKSEGHFFSKSWILLSFPSFFGGEKDFGQKQSLMVTQGSNGKSGSWHEIWRKFQFVSGPKCQNRGKSRTDQSQKRREMKQKTLKMFGSEKSAVNEIFV